MLMALQSCRLQTNEITIPDENAENVKLVLYYSNGDFDWKTVGEWMLIESGERLQVQRNKIRPEKQFITSEWSDDFIRNLEKSPQQGQVPLRLDRKNGIVCMANRCATLYAICPRRTEMRQGKKCATFNRD